MYSQFIQQNPELVQQAQAQMSAPPQAPTPAQPAPAPQPAVQAAPPAAQVAPVQQPEPNYAQAAGQFAGGMMNAGNSSGDGNQGMKDQSTLKDVFSIFSMFGGGGK